MIVVIIVMVVVKEKRVELMCGEEGEDEDNEDRIGDDDYRDDCREEVR